MVRGTLYTMKTSLSWICLVCAVLLVPALSVSAATPAKVKQKTFSSPEDAVKALVEAIKKDDEKEILAIFGPRSRWLIYSGDRVDDKARREGFLKAYEEMNKLVPEGEGKAVIYVGKQDHPFAIPIVKKGDRWVFDTKAGKEELLSRRIGRNELKVMEVLRAYADAQREYASKDRDGDGVLEFSQQLASGRNDHNGLYWNPAEGSEESPLGPLVAKAAAEGYGKKGKGEKPSPYHGYFYRILKGQGKNAKGGEYDYVVNDNMILGFAMVAYPAKYGSSGVKTFVVNQEGVICEKDLGKNTAKAAVAMKKYDPDETWKKVQE